MKPNTLQNKTLEVLQHTHIELNCSHKKT